MVGPTTLWPDMVCPIAAALGVTHQRHTGTERNDSGHTAPWPLYMFDGGGGGQGGRDVLLGEIPLAECRSITGIFRRSMCRTLALRFVFPAFSCVCFGQSLCPSLSVACGLRLGRRPRPPLLRIAATVCADMGEMRFIHFAVLIHPSFGGDLFLGRGALRYTPGHLSICTGPFTKKFGNGAINIVEAKVVLADGSLVTASKCSYGNFDIIWDHFSRISTLNHTPRALWAVFYLVLRLTSCCLVLAIRCCARFIPFGGLQVPRSVHVDPRRRRRGGRRGDRIHRPVAPFPRLHVHLFVLCHGQHQHRVQA